MDTKLFQRDHVFAPNGQPQGVTGIEKVLQQAFLSLSIPLGALPYEPTFGSRLHTLTPSDDLEKRATVYVEEALYPLEGVKVRQVQAVFSAPDVLTLHIDLIVESTEYTLEVPLNVS